MNVGPRFSDLPEIRSIGCGIWSRQRPQALGRHAHPHCWEIHYLHSGQLEWWLAGSLFQLQPGDCFLARPGQLHDGMNRIQHRSRISWLSLPLQGRGALPWLAAAQRRQLAADFDALSCLWFPGDQRLDTAFSILVDGVQTEPIDVTFIRATVLQILGLTLSSHAHARQHGKMRPGLSAVSKRAIKRLAKDLKAVPSVAVLADELGISKASFHRRFVAETGLSPNAYWQRLRIRQAQNLLRQECSAAAVAEQLGFATPQHFGRAFKSFTGLSPGRWRSADQACHNPAEK